MTHPDEHDDEQPDQDRGAQGPYRAADPAPDARLWIPGRVFEHDDGELSIGPSAGLCLDPWRSIHDWKSDVLVVRRVEVERLPADERDLLLPERAIDRARYPSLARWASLLPLVPVDPADLKHGQSLGLRVISVGFHRVSDGLGIHASGGGRPAVSLDGVVHSMWPGPSDDEGEDDASQRDEHAIDRMLRELTDGDADEVSVIAAQDAHFLLGNHVGRGPQGEELDRACHDAIWRQVFDRAGRQRDHAERILAAFDDATDPSATVAVPVRGGDARRVERRARTLSFVASAGSLADRYERAGARPGSLRLAPTSTWVLPPNDRWEPAPSDELAAEMRARARTRGALLVGHPRLGAAGLGRGRWLYLAALIGLVVLAILFAMQR